MSTGERNTDFYDYERRFLEICENLCTKCSPDGGAPKMAVLRAELDRAEALARVMELEARRGPCVRELMSRLVEDVSTLRSEQHKAMAPKRDLGFSTEESLSLAEERYLMEFETMDPSQVVGLFDPMPRYNIMSDVQCKKTTMESFKNYAIGCWKKMDPFCSF